MGKYALPVIERGDTSWADHAACRDHDPSLFFPGQEAHEAQVRQAKQVCAGCAVRIACLEDALTVPDSDQHGIYGGLTPHERREHKRHQDGCTCLTVVPMPNPPERWLPVPGWEDLYQVSDHGNVRSLDRRVSNGRGTRLKRGRMLRPVAGNGYLKVTLTNGMHRKQVFQVGRLVLTAFGPPPPSPNAVVRYGKDGPASNNIRNLTWRERRVREREPDLPGEQWRPVPGFEATHEVSSMGRVRNVRRRRLLTQFPVRGSMQVSFHTGDRHRSVLVARLVLSVFDSPPLPGATVLYGPGGKQDCSLRNLRWSRKPPEYWQRTTAFSGRYRGEPRSTAKHRQSPSARQEAS